MAHIARNWSARSLNWCCRFSIHLRSSFPLFCTALATIPHSLLSIMSIRATTTCSFFWLTVYFHWSAISWALTPPLEICSNGITSTNSSADQSISLQAQSNLSTVANQTSLLSSTAPIRWVSPLIFDIMDQWKVQLPKPPAIAMAPEHRRYTVLYSIHKIQGSHWLLRSTRSPSWRPVRYNARNGSNLSIRRPVYWADESMDVRHCASGHQFLWQSDCA